MIAEKIITTTQEIYVDVTGITLLSVEEAKKVDKNTRSVGDTWWLRSPGDIAYFAAIIFDDRYVDDIRLS